MDAMILLCWMLTSTPETICPPLPVGNHSQFSDDWRGETIDPGIFVELKGDDDGR